MKRCSDFGKLNWDTANEVEFANDLASQILIQPMLLMDHRVFRFATRGECIKGKQC